MAQLPPGVQARIARIREELDRLGLVCRGTVVRRTKVCGKPACRCAKDPEARHGPYYEWNRLRGKKLVHRTVTASQARALLRAIRNARRLRRLLRQWEEESADAILTQQKS